ncbi:MAG: FtsX-like permease family protein, partial [Verrucomicrobia bacterium]|nr:FtsX-like permease family protein [Verrucomicrobiota bacterium]
RVLVETPSRDGKGRVDTPYLRGIDPLLETNITVVPESIISGTFEVRNRGLLIGSEFARSMGLDVGDVLTIYSPEELKKIREQQRKGGEPTTVRPPDEYEVRGIFDVGYYEYNMSMIMTSLEDAQELYLLEDNVHGLLVMLHDPDQAAVVQGQLERVLGPDYRLITWMEENAGIINALVVEKNVMFYLLFFIMLVAALCILSALITFVVQKTREIGVLKALGATDTQVGLLFLSQGGFVGVAGVVAGFGLGMLALAYRNEFLHLMNRITGFELFPRSVYNFVELPALIIPRDVILICGSALVICILGGVIPAWRAARLKPVEALRHE